MGYRNANWHLNHYTKCLYLSLWYILLFLLSKQMLTVKQYAILNLAAASYILYFINHLIALIASFSFVFDSVPYFVHHNSFLYGEDFQNSFAQLFFTEIYILHHYVCSYSSLLQNTITSFFYKYNSVPIIQPLIE